MRKLILALMVVCFIFLGCQDPDRACPPEGWKIVKNEKYYRWVKPNDIIGEYMTLWNYSSEKKAIKAAWGYYDYINNPKNIKIGDPNPSNWVEVKCELGGKK